MDAALNNYVALHYASRHMSWLHCMWGLGASAGPYIMGFTLILGQKWNTGYLYISILQILLTAVLFLSIPLWKERVAETSALCNTTATVTNEKPLSFGEILKLRGAKAVMIVFFCYCALEQTAGLWASSYMVLQHGIDAQTAANYASLFYIGITIGRGISGFITMKLNDRQMIRLGCGIIFIGITLLLLPIGDIVTLVGLITIGLGCAPIYPCVIHSTPELFGAENSQAIIGVQMASAYVGTCLMPPLFGLIANHISVTLYPVFLMVILVAMFGMHEKLIRQTMK